ESPLITGILDSTICNGASFVFNGTTYDASNLTGNEILTAANGCDSVVIINLTILPDLIAFFTGTPNSGSLPLVATFDQTGSSTGADVVYSWDYGNGSGAIGPNPTTTFDGINTYDVELTVSDSNACGNATYVVTIEVFEESVILIPNIFTPNGDGQNDFFTVKGTSLESVEGEIYNRWGQKMFSWSHIKGYWDGRTLAGSEAPDGTYFYMVKAVGMDGEEYFKKGGFTLIR
ncbi:MAG: hypothetical protein COB15_01190, partial [Flavobacteriales bacterium]